MSDNLIKHTPTKSIQAAFVRPVNAIIIAVTLIATFVFWQFWWVFFITFGGLLALGGSFWVAYNSPELQALQQAEIEEIKAQEVIDDLEAWVLSVSVKVPTDIRAKITNIKNSLLTILPQMENISSSDQNTFMIRQIAQSYLPETIDNYLRLPPDFATNKKLRNGKTPHELLLSQLELLDEEMQGMVEDFYQNDTQRIMAHGRFLRDKFGTSDLLDL
ncbi:hypothetical protein QUF63_17245 [Anaerolineales bacterium HSG25]|nr:hypothetical protein [Anaerolineales bacterium HSG25]